MVKKTFEIIIIISVVFTRGIPGKSKQIRKLKVKIKGKVDILANFPIDTSLKKKTHSALLVKFVISSWY